MSGRWETRASLVDKAVSLLHVLLNRDVFRAFVSTSGFYGILTSFVFSTMFLTPAVCCIYQTCSESVNDNTKFD